MTDKKEVAKKEVAKKVEKKEIPAKDTQNGITRPNADTLTGSVWKIADDLSAALKGPIGRKEVLEAAAEKELNPSTAATQYGRWRKYNGLSGTGSAPKEAAPKAAAEKAKEA